MAIGNNNKALHLGSVTHYHHSYFTLCYLRCFHFFVINVSEAFLGKVLL